MQDWIHKCHFICCSAIIHLMRILKATLFDIDGTLLDTSEFIFQAYEHTLDKYGYPQKSREEIAMLIGKSLEVCYKMLTGIDDVQELSEAHREFQLGHLHLSKAYPKTHNTLETLRSAGIKIAAITTRSKASALKTLELAGLCKYMDYTIALEDVENLKPHPEPLIKTLNYLGVLPENAAMIGDTDVDILAGKNAGTVTVGVTYGFHGRRIIESDPDHVVDDIAEIIPLVLPSLARKG